MLLQAGVELRGELRAARGELCAALVGQVTLLQGGLLLLVLNHHHLTAGDVKGAGGGNGCGRRQWVRKNGIFGKVGPEESNTLGYCPTLRSDLGVGPWGLISDS